MILRELLAKFGVAYDDTGAKRADKDVSGLKSAAVELVGLIGGAAMIRSFGQFVLGQVEMADAMGDTAERIGIGVEALQELRYAAVGAGLGADQVDSALARMGRGAADAAKGQGAAKDAFKELGVTLTDSSGNLVALDQIVTQVSDGLARTGNESDRARLGFDLFGREGSKFTETLKGGSVALEQVREQARALGGVLTEEQVAAADKADKAINEFKFGLQGLRNEIAQRLIPHLTKGVGWLLDWVKAAQDIARHSHIIEGAIAAAGVAFAALLGGARLLAITKAGIAFALIALAIDDIITFAKGGDSVIGRLLDAVGGAGTSAEVLRGLKDTVDGVVLALKDIAKFQNFLDTDFFGAAGSGEGFDRFAVIVNRAHRALAQLANFYRKYSGNAVGADFDVPALMEPFKRTTGPGVNADVRLPGSDGIPRAGRGVNSELQASGRAEEQGMPASYAGLPPAFASTQQMTPASGPVTVEQNVSIRVDGSGIGDPDELARIIDRRLRKGLAETNARSLRSLRQVPP
jgi:hypothetical protein